MVQVLVVLLTINIVLVWTLLNKNEEREMIKVRKSGPYIIIESIKRGGAQVTHIHHYIFRSRKQLRTDLVTLHGTAKGIVNCCEMLKKKKKWKRCEDVTSDNIDELPVVVYDKVFYYCLDHYLRNMGILEL